MKAPVLVETLRRRGFTLSAAGGRLEVRPASGLTGQDREAIRSYLADLIALLTPPDAPPRPTATAPWDGATAIRLMCDADALVARSGVDGNHPLVKDAAAMVASAFATRDLETLRFAVAEFAVVVRGLASAQVSGTKAGQNTAKTAARMLPSRQTVPRPDSGGTGCGRDT